jgi:hypothetical protein
VSALFILALNDEVLRAGLIKKHRQILFLKVEESNLGVQKTGDAYC